jgi:hypothetical protein
MKRFSLIIFLLSLFCFSSCKKFLSESSQDEIRPTTTTDLYSLLIGTAYSNKTKLDVYIDLLTDDIQCNGLPKNLSAPSPTFNTLLQSGYYLFRFDPNMFERTELNMTTEQNSWLNYFKFISGCNLVLDYLDKVSGSDTEKKFIKGQALFLRAFYYFKLVNIYGRPYDEATSDPATNLAVPLILSSKVSDERMARNTVKAVYDQVEKDLLEAEQLLGGYTPGNNYRITQNAARAMLSRMYLYKGSANDLVTSAKYASQVIEARPSLTLLTTYFTAPATFSLWGIYDAGMSQEVIWNYGANPSESGLGPSTVYYPFAATVLNKLPPFVVSNDLLALYERGADSAHMGDLRYTSYFVKYYNGGLLPFISGKSDPNNNNVGNRGIRTAEMYLNRAEAIIRLNQQGNSTAGTIDKALEDINTLRTSRYDTRNTSYVPVQITDMNALWSFYKDERRRELCLEDGHRWFDVRRWQVPIHHRYIDVVDQVYEVDLPSGSLLYALPIPYSAMESNANLQQNPR